MDYYDILGVNKNATQDEIKKQYKKKALIIHPDKKNGNEEKFKELSEAYSILSDEKKKQNYDMFGKDYDKISQHDDVFNLFSKMQHTQPHNVFNFMSSITLYIKSKNHLIKLRSLLLKPF